MYSLESVADEYSDGIHPLEQYKNNFCIQQEMYRAFVWAIQLLGTSRIVGYFVGNIKQSVPIDGATTQHDFTEYALM